MNSRRILIIDSEQLMCHGLKKALHRDHIQVDTASSVTDALMSCAGLLFDLCIFDIRLPDENGLRMVEALRSHWPGMNIILMTACDFGLDDNAAGYVQQIINNGVCHFLCKPFELQQLKELVTHTLYKGTNNSESSGPVSDFAVRIPAEGSSGNRQDIFFSMSVIREGEVKRSIYPAEPVEIDNHGMVLITWCLLKPRQVISFDEQLGRKSGIVIWSSLLDDERCKAGIRFA